MWQLRLPDTGFFTDLQRRQVTVLFDAILPSVNGSPGAGDVGAVDYADLLLAMDPSVYREIPAWRQRYTEFLPLLDAASAEMYAGQRLVDLDREEATVLLSELRRGALPDWPDQPQQQGVFTLLRTHCVEGCFVDPRWGGNQRAVMWRWFGYLTPAEGVGGHA